MYPQNTVTPVRLEYRQSALTAGVACREFGTTKLLLDGRSFSVGASVGIPDAKTAIFPLSIVTPASSTFPDRTVRDLTLGLASCCLAQTWLAEPRRPPYSLLSASREVGWPAPRRGQLPHFICLGIIAYMKQSKRLFSLSLCLHTY